MLLDPPGPLTDDDRLFNTGGPWVAEVDLAFRPLRDYRYIDGFSRAAEVLGDRVDEFRGDADALVMPILFCYRQWIELRLKDLWIEGSRLQDREVDVLTGHDLRRLWSSVRPLIEEAWQEDDRAELDQVGRVLGELAEFDGRGGTGFRYATTLEGSESLPPETSINLRNVREVMKKIAVLLEGAAEGISVMLEHRAEMRAEYGP